jgi:competence protein ComEA
MKNWHYPLLSIFAGVILLAIIHLVSSPPRGTSVVLLPAPTPAPLTIHLTGAVNQPGVYTVQRGSRVIDVVETGGGLRSDANGNAVNLAAAVKDGQKIHIPAVGEPLPQYQAGPSSEGGSILVNINTAGSEELQLLPGIGPTRADQIIAFREKQGGFKSIEEILEVPGIGPATLEQIRLLITLEE